MKVSVAQLVKHYKSNDAIKIKEVLIKRKIFTVIYIESLINILELEKNFLPKLEELILNNDHNKNLLSLEKMKDVSISKIDKKIYSGHVCVCHGKEITTFKLTKIPNRNPTPSINDITTVGAQDCFVESIDTNIGLLMYRYRNSNLRVYDTEIGIKTKTRACIMYLEGTIENHLLEEVKSRVSKLKLDSAINISQIENELVKTKRNSVFPLINSIFKPDYCINSLEKGKFVIFVDGIPTALVGPATLESIISLHYSMQENKYTNIFEKGLTYLCLFIAVFLGGLIVAIVSYHPDFLPYLLLTNIYGGGKGVFLPFAIQMPIAELCFQMFRLAGSKLPSHLGSTIIILGSLVVSRIGVETGLFAPFVLISISLILICTYAISSNNSFNVGFTLARLFIGFASLFWGLVGFTFSSLLVLIYLLSLDSFGVPYLYPFAPYQRKKGEN